ncbi:MAG: TRAM domain-containing protein [Synergistaceae bacterium]|nr:TRAM domain-containing protein [Synergistota bacterium]NLM70352.1 TRAM domain-containing protein [Synergistaceae bacterium]
MTEGFGKLVQFFFSGLMVFIGGMVGAQIAWLLLPLIPVDWFLAGKEWLPLWLPGRIVFTVLCVSLFAFVGLMFSPLVIRLLGLIGASIEMQLKNASWSELTAATAGIIIGLLIANLIAMPFSDLPLGSYVAVVLNVVLAYLGASILLKRQSEMQGVLTPIKGIRERLSMIKTQQQKGEDGRADDMGSWEIPKKILDTSVIIDGRILDVARTGFLEGIILIPQFVLHELQSVADSTDPSRRTRGRRGMDVVNELQRLADTRVEIADLTLRDLEAESVDSALVVLAERLSGQIMTTDYNLNKLAQIQGIPVLNVNDLANAMKPMLLPGETIIIDVIREGKEPQQGVGYLDDGTMFVVEDGEAYIGKRVEVVVTSMLQTSAGRMVFGRIRREVRAP